MSPLSSKGAFHPHCFITDHTNQTQVEQCWLGDVHLGLPDIDTENMTNFRMLNSWITDLVEDYKIDGLRISSARYIRKSFWQDFKTAAGVFCLGEVGVHPDLLHSTSTAFRRFQVTTLHTPATTPVRHLLVSGVARLTPLCL